MDHRYSNLLSELRYAMDEAFGKSERVSAAIMAVQHAGKGVEIAIHAALVDLPQAGSPANEGHTESRGMLTLNATDMLFLRALKISVETGVGKR